MILYELLVFLGWLIFTPRLLWQAWFQKKSIPSLFDRLGFPLPPRSDRPLFWIHAVSLGEMKASRPLCKQIKQAYPESILLLTTATATGKKEAHQIPEADLVRYLPLDLLPIQKIWAKRLRPKALFCIEGDIWPRMLQSVRAVGGKTILVSGKLSARSFNRLSCFPWVAQKLYSHFDLLLVQNQEYATRFQTLLPSHSVHIAGNLKLAQSIPLADPLPIPTSLPIVALTCTHAPEEEELLPLLLQLPIFLVIAPRHPERFQTVAEHLQAKSIPFTRFTAPQTKDTRVLLFDTIGKLPELYRAAQVAVLGGSFSSKIGGHNPLESLFQGTPVLFGPHMHLQIELAHIALETGMAKQITTADLPQAIHSLLNQKREVTASFSQLGQEVLGRHWQAIEKELHS